MKQLYQEVILDHNKYPRNYGEDASATHTAEGFNPLCGDKLTLYLTVEDNKVVKASFKGDGCAISVAAASLMTEHIIGMHPDEVKDHFTKVHEMLTKKVQDQDLGKLLALSNVSDYPARVKCASLCWHTLMAALEGDKEPVKTE